LCLGSRRKKSVLLVPQVLHDAEQSGEVLKNLNGDIPRKSGIGFFPDFSTQLHLHMLRQMFRHPGPCRPLFQDFRPEGSPERVEMADIFEPRKPPSKDNYRLAASSRFTPQVKLIQQSCLKTRGEEIGRNLFPCSVYAKPPALAHPERGGFTARSSIRSHAACPIGFIYHSRASQQQLFPCSFFFAHVRGRCGREHAVKASPPSVPMVFPLIRQRDYIGWLLRWCSNPELRPDFPRVRRGNLVARTSAQRL